MNWNSGPADLVSVVIPTVGRASLLETVKSVQNQTYSTIEILVVQDGVDEQAKTQLETLGDRRIRVLTQFPPRGASAARNLGVREARGRYIAFLDDDDTFLPAKLAIQVIVSKQQPNDRFYVVCSALVDWENRREVWPRRFPLPTESIADYLFSRSLKARRAFLQTSCLLIPRNLLLDIPFNEDLEQHQDWDWLLEAELDGVQLIPIKEPLVRYRVHNAAGSISTRATWRNSLAWLRRRRSSFSRETYSFFIATYVMDRAQAQERFSRSMLSKLLHEFMSVGRPNFIAWVYLAVSFLQMKRFIRDLSRQNCQDVALPHDPDLR